MYLVSLSLLFTVISSKIILHEEFDGDWLSRWVPSSKSDTGKFVLASPKDSESEYKRLKTSEDAKFYHIARKFVGDASISTGKTPLHLLMTVQFEQDIDCGGGYVKLIPCSHNKDLSSFDGNSEYSFMFGPDVCGSSNQHVHAILNYNGTNHLIKDKITIDNDVLPHLYEFILKPDKKFEVLIDGKSKKSGDIESEWDVFQSPEIFDPLDQEPIDWVKDENIVDPNDKKPEDWDKPQYIPDKEAKKPNDWNDEEDGEWEPPQISNPDYKGTWEPKKIKNPAYKGEYKRRKIANPEYFKDPSLAVYDICYLGIDLWQVKSGTLMGPFMITDDENEASKFRKSQLEINEKIKEVIEKAKKAQEEKDKEEKDKANEKSSGDKSDDKADEIPSSEEKPKEEEKEQQQDGGSKDEL